MKLRYCNLFIFLSIVSLVYGQDYYWYENEKVFLQRGDERYVLFSTDKKSVLDTSIYLKIGVASDTSMMWGIQKKEAPIANNVIYMSPSFCIKGNAFNMYLTEQFYVQLKNKEDYGILEGYAKEYDVKIIGEGASQPWYILSCTKESKGNALEMANLFYESGLFAATEPEFINANRFVCVNDIHFDQQWNLLNTGQQNSNNIGLDINYCEAHATTDGDNSIIIAVIDGGIASHFDVSHLHSISYDANYESYPQQIYDQHGTQCAGIIGAHTNNHHGIAGISPDCPILSISFSDYTSGQKIAKGIKYAIEHNAAVLSNSWKRYGGSTSIKNAIDSALTYGRNGKGCVVVCAAGNDYSSGIVFPASSNTDNIVVGAMNPNAERANFSSYGLNLDIMAPGVNIPTTIPDGLAGSFCMNFEGTSAACPHVAAVAGLVLSINPDLTQKEVAMIIEGTAQKVGNYSYDSIAPHGSWDYEMGYGLVDAYAAVLMARDRYIQDTTFYLTDTIYDIDTFYTEPIVMIAPNTIYAGQNVTTFKPVGDVVIPSGSDVHFRAGNSIHLKPGFKVNLGAHFYAEIGNAPLPIATRESPEKYFNEEDAYNDMEKPTEPLTKEVTKSRKVIRNGKLLIIHGKETYNAHGMRQ